MVVNLEAPYIVSVATWDIAYEVTNIALLENESLLTILPPDYKYKNKAFGFWRLL